MYLSLLPGGCGLLEILNLKEELISTEEKIADQPHETGKDKSQ